MGRVMDDGRGMLVVVSGPRQSGRSTVASDEVVPWLRKQGGGRVVLVDVGDNYASPSAIEADVAEGYHVCVVSNDARFEAKADILLVQNARTTFTTTSVRNSVRNPWAEEKEIPF